MGSASTGWFGAGSNPTVETKCDVSMSKSGTIVTVNWTTRMKLSSSGSYLGSGSLEAYCTCGGINDGKTIKEHSSSWSGTGEHVVSGSFTFDSGNTGAQTFEVNFWSDSDYFSSSGIYDEYINCSVDASVSTPTVTCSITGRTSSSISASMSVTNDGGASIVDRYIDLFSDSACTKKVGTITGASGTFTGLNPNTTYYAKANASNGTYRGYSSVQSQTTYQRTIPTISLSSKSVNSVTVTSGCNVTVSSTQYRIKTASGSYGAYQNSATFSGLSPNTSYVVEVRKVGQASGEAGTATLNVTTHQIGTISSASNFNHGDNASLVVANPSGASLNLQMKIGNNQIFSKSVSAGTVTHAFTDEQLDNIYKLYGTGNSLTVTYILTTTANGTSYTNSKTCTITFTGNQKTTKVGVNGVKRAKVYVGVNGSVKKAVIWVGVNNVGKRCI